MNKQPTPDQITRARTMYKLYGWDNLLPSEQYIIEWDEENQTHLAFEGGHKALADV